MKINVDILRALYEQYFCNVFEYTDEQLISLHFKCNEALDEDEDLFWDDLPFSDMAVWRPFEDVMPTYIFDNILEGHKRLWDLHDESYNQICLELSCDLAEERIVEYFTEELGENFEYTDENGETRLNEDAQDLFNQYQEFYENKIREALVNV